MARRRFLLLKCAVESMDDEAAASIKNILLSEDSSAAVKSTALEFILGLTDTLEKCVYIFDSGIFTGIVSAAFKSSNDVSTFACSILINISYFPEGVTMMLENENHKELLLNALFNLVNVGSPAADSALTVLCNMTRAEEANRSVVQFLDPLISNLKVLLDTFLRLEPLSDGGQLHKLAFLFSNLTQCPAVRRCFIDPENSFLQKLLPFILYPGSSERREGVVGVIRNCCFEYDSHEWLLKEVDILPRLLLPLAGNEEFDDEDNDKLPIELQYLDNAKCREVNHSIREKLLEALFQLCATRSGREFIREKNTYVILRELHKWELNPECIAACENVVDILIKTEDEIGVDSYAAIDVPSEMTEKFIANC